MDLAHGPIVEVFSRVVEKSRALLTSFFKSPPVKAFHFALKLGLGIGRTVRLSQKNNGLTHLPPVYTLRDENIFRLNLQYRHTKAVKADCAEIETSIWNAAAAELFQGGYRAKRHETIFQHLVNIMAKCFKRNVARSFVCYMVDAYGHSRRVWQEEIRKERDRYLEASSEALYLFGKSNF